MNLRSASVGLFVFLFAKLVFTPAAADAASCESLTSLSLPNTTITLAQSVAAGEFSLPATGPGAAEQNAIFKQLPAFCKVAATLKPSSDSDIKIEVWMPLASWNNKFQAVGNGGWAGSITYTLADPGRGVARGMAEALKRGYATSSTDTGHSSNSTPGGSFALGHPEKLIDYGYRSVHEMTVKAKAIIDAFYGIGPKLSYWNGAR